MALVGLSVFAVHLVAAYLGYLVLLAVWADRPSLPAAAAVLLGLTVGFGWLSYRTGTRRLLSALDAVALTREGSPRVYRLLDGLTAEMRAGNPTLYVARMRTPNAFALGDRRRGVVVLDRSLFHLLSADELEALLAHELAHVENYDGFVQTLAYSAISTVVELLFLALLPLFLVASGASRGLAWIRGRPSGSARGVPDRSPSWVQRTVLLLLFLITVSVRAHSRRREYAADDRAAAVTADPLALARALRKIDRAAEPRWGVAAPLYVHADEDDPLTRLLDTHPPIDDRIERLVSRVGAHGNPGTGGRTIEIR